MDTFFSGSSDVALPEGGGRRAASETPRDGGDLEARAPHFCERCDESIPLSELAVGRARIVYGLAFCVRCAPLLEEERYRVYSCDRCGASIPVERIEGGEALAGDGHVYCERCRRRPSRVVRIARRAALPAALALTLLLGVAGVIWWPRSSRVERPPDLERDLRVLRARLERISSGEEEAEDLVRSLDSERERFEATLERAGVLEERVDRLRALAGENESPQPADTERR